MSSPITIHYPDPKSLLHHPTVQIQVSEEFDDEKESKQQQNDTFFTSSFHKRPLEDYETLQSANKLSYEQQLKLLQPPPTTTAIVVNRVLEIAVFPYLQGLAFGMMTFWSKRYWGPWIMGGCRRLVAGLKGVGKRMVR